MATGAGFSSLTRRAKKGTFDTTGANLPESTGVIGAVEDPADSQQVDASLLPAASPRPMVSDASSSAAPDADLLDFLNEASDAPAPRLTEEAPHRAAQAESEGHHEAGQIERKSVSMPGTSKFSALANKGGAAKPAPARSYEREGGTFSSLVKPGQDTGTRAARHDVHAIKVVTRLVQAIAFKPGTTADKRLKSAELQRMLGDVHRTAAEVALAASPLDAHRGWVLAMCTEAMAELVAARTESDAFDEPVDLDSAVQAIKDVFASAGHVQAVAQAVDAMADSRYVEASSAAVANDRIRVSLGLASWELYDSVRHPRLGTENFRYTYDRKPEEIVTKLSEEIFRIAREANITGGSQDMRTAHFQGSLRRLAKLVGSEYVNRTREVMNWIAQAQGDDEYKRRCDQAAGVLDSQILPEVIELARRNFVAIEQLAPKLLEESKHADGQAPRHAG